MAKKIRPGERPEAAPDGHASWRFESVDFEFLGSDGWSGIDPEALKTIFRVMKSVEQEPMSRVRQRNTHQIGSIVRYDAEVIDQRFSAEARRRLSDINLGDLPDIQRLRISGNRRLYFWEMNAHTFNIVWWDPEHLVYPLTSD